MPIISVELFEGRSRKQRQEFARAVTQAAVSILKAPPTHTWVIFKEYSKSYWAMAGKMCDR